MRHYDKNLEILREYRADLYQFIQNHDKKEEESADLRISSIPARDDSLALVISIDGKEYRMNSAYHPKKEAQQWSSQFEIINLGTVISMYGFGNGVFLRQLLERVDETVFVLVYEPSASVFLHVIENYDITDLLENTRVLIAVEGLNGEDFKDRLEQIITWTNMNSQIVCIHPQYDKAFFKESLKFLRVISENNSRTEINRNTNAFFGRDIIENTIKNLKYVQNANTVLDLASEVFGEVPAIIVSAGPSLDKNIDLLKEAKGKAVIVATDTAMKFLYAHNIIPDCFVTLDAMKPESYLNDERFMEVPLFTKVESNWRILHRHKARKIFYSCQEYMENLYQKLGKEISHYTSGGSVATGAFSVCAALGFKRIVLIGQDLAYAGEKTHAGDLTDRIRGEEEGARYVEGIDGGQVKTRHDWYIYLKWFESAIEEVKSFIEVIDATEGGAKIQGSRIMSLREAIDEYCVKDIDFADFLSKKENTLTKTEVQQIFEMMKETSQELSVIKRKSEEAERICEDILRVLKKDNRISERLTKESKKLERLNNEIESGIAYKLIDGYIADVSMNLMASIYQFTSNEETDRLNTYQRAYVLYQTITSTATAIKLMLEEALEEFWNMDTQMEAGKKKKVVAIMQARMGSTRLSGKVMRKLYGKTILEHDIERLKQSDRIDEIVIATTLKDQDEVIVNEGKRLGIPVFRGSEDDVLSRFYCAAKDHRADIVVRITSDCPLIDPFVVDKTIEYYMDHDYDIVTNAGMGQDTRTFPRGLDVEVFSNEKLRLAYQYARETYQREHVTPYLYEKFKTGFFVNETNYSNYRWTLDTEEDWRLIEAIYQRLYHGTHNFYFDDILALMKEHPELAEINKEIEQKKIK